MLGKKRGKAVWLFWPASTLFSLLYLSYMLQMMNPSGFVHIDVVQNCMIHTYMWQGPGA